MVKGVKPGTKRRLRAEAKRAREEAAGIFKWRASSPENRRRIREVCRGVLNNYKGLRYTQIPREERQLWIHLIHREMSDVGFNKKHAKAAFKQVVVEKLCGGGSHQSEAIEVKRVPEMNAEQGILAVEQKPGSYVQLFSHDWPLPGQWPREKPMPPDVKEVKRDFNGWDEKESGSDESESE